MREVGENPGNEVVSVCFLFQESRYYYKIVPCSKVPEIEEELNKLLSGKLKNCLVVSLLRATPFPPPQPWRKRAANDSPRVRESGFRNQGNFCF